MANLRVLRICLSLIGAVFATSGCNRGPTVEPGPAPLGASGKPVTRLVETRGGLKTRHEIPFWDEGDGPVEAAVRIAELENAVPDDLSRRLETTVTVDRNDGGPPFEWPAYYARATVISLSPDAMLPTVREWQEGKTHPYEDWNAIGSEKRFGMEISENTELIKAWSSFT